jgi:hypothetical protein
MNVFRNTLFSLVVSIAIFLFVFISVEGAFRFIGIPYSRHGYIPNENSFAMFDPELGWSYISDKTAIHEVGDGKIKKPLFFDKNRIRVPHSNFKFDGSRPSVLFIGGSFTMGHGLSYEESFVGKFDAFKEVPYQIVNLGVQGYGSDQAFLTLKKYLTKFNVKVVVYTFIEDHILRNGIYDRRMLIPTTRFLGTKPLLALDEDRKVYILKKPVLYENYFHSYLLDFLKMRIGSLMGNFPPYPAELTKEIILEMKRYSNDHGAHFVVLNWRWTDNDYYTMFQDMDVNVIDTMDNAPTDWRKMVILEGIHPDPLAGNHAAKVLLQYFRQNNLL